MTRPSNRLTVLLCGAALGAAFTTTGVAAVPKKQPPGRYTELWTKSPFTVPPPVEVVEKIEENPLEDFTLAGVCEIKGGWFVVLMNKKERDQRVRIKPGEKNSENFKVVHVEEGAKYLEARVQIETPSGKTGWVEYDEKFIALKKATPQAPQGRPNPAQNNPRQVRPPIPTPNQPAARPPIPTPNASGTTNSSTDRPSRVRRRTVPSPPSR